MHKLTDPSFQSRVAAQKSSESARESVGTLNPVTTTHSLESERRRAIQIAKALARPHLHLWILLLVYTFTIPTIGLLANQRHVNYVYNGTILFIIGGVATGFTLTRTERPLLLAGVTSRESRHNICLGDHRTHRHQYGVLRCLGHHPRGCQSCRCLHDTAHWNRPLSLVPRSIGRIPRGYCVSMYEYSEQILKFWGHRRRCRTNCPTHESNLLPHYSSCFSFRSTRVRLLSPRSSSCLPPAPAIHPESTSQRGMIHPRRNSGRSSAPPQRPCHMTPVMRLR